MSDPGTGPERDEPMDVRDVVDAVGGVLEDATPLLRAIRPAMMLALVALAAAVAVMVAAGLDRLGRR